MTTSIADIAWAAGLFDGEGSIGVLRNARKHRVLLRINMTHKAGVDRFASIVSNGRVRPQAPVRPPPRLPSHVWRGSCGAAHEVLLMLRQHLTVKASEADIALEYLAIEFPTAVDGDRLIEQLRGHKSKGRRIALNRIGSPASVDAVQ